MHAGVLIRFFISLLMLAAIARPAAAQTADVSGGSAAALPQGTPQSVELGFYPISIYDLDMSRNSYFIDFYLWVKWRGPVDPLKTMRFVNMVDEWDSMKERSSSGYVTLPDGTKYDLLRIEGRFVRPFDFRSFPFDRQTLEIVVEDDDHATNAIVYSIDAANSKLDKDLRIAGWEIDSSSTSVTQRYYDSTFGIANLNSTYSSAALSVVISRPASLFYWKLMTPLTIILLAALSSLLLPPRQIDARTALVASGLLTAVFLQRTYLDGLPDISYFVMMDKIYIAAYAVIILCLLRVVYSFLRTQTAPEIVHKRYRNSDTVIMAGLLAAFLLAASLLVATA